MTRPRVSTLYLIGLMVVLFGVTIHAPLSVYFGTLWPEQSLIIKAWKELLLLALTVIAAGLLTHHKLWSRFAKSWVVRVALVYVAIHILLVCIIPTDIRATAAGLLIDLRYVGMFLLMYVLILIRPNSLKVILTTIAAGAAVVLGFGALQITLLPDDVLRPLGYSPDTIRPYTTIDRNPDFVRINSTLRGPNPLGALMVIYLALALAYIHQIWHTRASVRYRWWVIGGAALLSVAVLFASYSRSAYIAAIAATLVMAGSVLRLTKKSIVIIAGVALVTGAGVFALQHTDWYSNVILHEDPESTVVSKSNQGHVDSLAEGATRMLRQPLGAGIGSTGSASMYDNSGSNDVVIENWYLFVAHESGWLGLATFSALLVGVCVELYRRRSHWLAIGLLASGVGLSLIGLLLPVWADETVAIIWWGLAGAILGRGYDRRTRQ